MRYDVAIIGGGPAGMIAAGRAGEVGAHVVLVEKNKYLGLKLLITGKGRCNITNKASQSREIINKFGQNGKFLFSAFSKFDTNKTIRFFEDHGLKMKVERGNRVFPVSNKSKDVLNVLVKYMRAEKVEIMTDSRVGKVIRKKKRIEKIILAGGEEIGADNFIICTGGKSYSLTGSTGDGYQWARKMGHTIVSPSPALVPVIAKERWVKKLEGLSLKNVRITIFKDGREVISRFGEAIFTANGMSGPIILDMSKSIGQALPGEVVMKIDLKPALDFVKLDKRVQRDFQKNYNKLFRNSLDALLPKRLIRVAVRLSRINPLKRVGDITKEERGRLLHFLKGFSLTITGLGGFKRAIITTGGVSLDEVDQKTMRSKLIDNLYFAGEILDVDGPTGGYNLQVCWTTGYVAGESAGRAKLKK